MKAREMIDRMLNEAVRPIDPSALASAVEPFIWEEVDNQLIKAGFSEPQNELGIDDAMNLHLALEAAIKKYAEINVSHRPVQEPPAPKGFKDVYEY